MSENQNIVLLCPGQGAQHVGMGREWVQNSPAAAQTFERANQVLGMDLGAMCFDGPEETLSRTDVAQAALYTASVASYLGLREAGEDAPIAATAGLSLGEFTALHLAGAYDFETGLRLVRLRGEAMQQAAEATSSSMVALVGADESQANALCDAARGNDVLVPANFNCPGQVVISGSQSACERALVEADKMGLRATALKVAGAFHSPLMQPAADRLAAALDEANWQQPTVPVLSNVTAKPHDSGDIDSIKKRLVEQLTSPVRWDGCMQWATANIQGRFVELAPGKVLSGLMRRINREVKVVSAAQPQAKSV